MYTYIFAIESTCTVEADTYEEAIEKVSEISKERNSHVTDLIDTDSDEDIF